MIEKFTNEELEIIKRELGIIENDKTKKDFVCRVCREELRQLWSEKTSLISVGGDKIRNSLYVIIDVTLCNFRKKTVNKTSKKNGEKFQKTYIGFDGSVSNDIADEYERMFREMLEVIKKYDKKYEP